MAETRAWTLVPKGRVSGSRTGWLLWPPGAGAAHGAGSEDKLASLILSLSRPSERDIILVWEGVKTHLLISLRKSKTPNYIELHNRSQPVRTIGFEMAKCQIRWTILGGSRSKPEYQSHGRSMFRLDEDRRRLLDETSKIFLEVLTQHQVDLVAYRVSTNAPKIEQIAYLHFPLGALLLRCGEKNLPAVELNSSSFTHRRLQFTKGLDKYAACDATIGSHAPHWDTAQRNSALSAWSA